MATAVDDQELVEDTTSDVDDEAAHRKASRARVGRRLFAVLLAAFLVLGVLGVFGVKSGTKAGSGGGYDVDVTYARTTRPGVSTPLDIEITHDGGIPESQPVRVAISSAYVDVLQIARISPEPSSSTADADRVVWEFDPPSGDTLAVHLSAEIDPSADAGRRHGTISLLEADSDRAVTSVRFTTWVLP
jgi:hypothetical protein